MPKKRKKPYEVPDLYDLVMKVDSNRQIPMTITRGKLQMAHEASMFLHQLRLEAIAQDGDQIWSKREDAVNEQFYLEIVAALREC